MNSRSTYAAFALVCTIFGTTFLAIRIGLLAGASPLLYAGIRFFSAGSLLLGLLLTLRRTTFRQLRALLARSILISVFLTAATFGLMFLAETRIESGYMARLDAVGPVVTAMFAALVSRTAIRGGHIAGFVAGTVGVLLLATRVGGGADSGGVIAAAGSVIAYAFGMALYPKLFRPEEDPVAVNALQMTAGGALLLLVAPFVEKPSLPMTASALLPLLYLVVAGSIVAHSANLVVIRNSGPVFASAWLYVAPPIATAFGALVLGESIGVAEAAGTVLALAGCYLISHAERRGARTEAASVRR